MKTLHIGDGIYVIYCPACKTHHHFTTLKPWAGPGTGPWQFNGNYESPSFSPSLNLKGGKYADLNWYNNLDAEHKSLVDETSFICHSVVDNGTITFQGDCTHGMKGQTVTLPDLPRPSRFAREV